MRVDIEVVDVPERHRFEARADGEMAGYIAYQHRTDAIELIHTEVKPAFEGKGVGSALVRQVLDGIKGRGGQMIPTCPFVTEYVRRHPEYVDLVVEARRAQFTER
jgi:hypothetical protein